jgi:hypothetical protein
VPDENFHLGIPCSELSSSVNALEKQTAHSPEVAIKESVAKVENQLQQTEQKYQHLNSQLQSKFI